MKSYQSKDFIKVIFYTLGMASFILGVASLAGFGYTVITASHLSEDISLSDAYNNAKEAVAEEESLERKYRLEPNQATLARYEAATKELQRSLNEVANLGDAAPVARSGLVDALTLLRCYLELGERQDVLLVQAAEALQSVRRLLTVEYFVAAGNSAFTAYCEHQLG